MKVLIVSGIDGDSRRYRCYHHQEQLAIHEIASTFREIDDLQLYVDATSHDLVILQRTRLTPLINDLIEIARSRHIPVVFETDDLVFRPDLYAQIGFADTLPPDKARLFRRGLQEQRDALNRCDAVLVTTGYLANMARDEGKPAYIQRNACSQEMVSVAEAAYRQRQKAAKTAHSVSSKDARSEPESDELPAVVVGYLSGTGSHNRDFALIAPVLLELMHEFPHLHLQLGGHLSIDPQFDQFGDRIRRAPYVSWRELPNLIAQLDINLAPLELDNPFCQAKSEIKYTEAALVAVPTVASPVDAYQFAIENGKTGFLAATGEEWRTALRKLIVDAGARRAMGERARQHVYQQYLAEMASQRLVETLDKIVADYQRHSSATSSAETADNTATIVAQRMKAHIDQAQTQIDQLTGQLADLRQTLEQWEDNQQQIYWRRQWESTTAKHTDDLRTILARLQKNRQS